MRIQDIETKRLYAFKCGLPREAKAPRKIEKKVNLNGVYMPITAEQEYEDLKGKLTFDKDNYTTRVLNPTPEYYTKIGKAVLLGRELAKDTQEIYNIIKETKIRKISGLGNESLKPISEHFKGINNEMLPTLSDEILTEIGKHIAAGKSLEQIKKDINNSETSTFVTTAYNNLKTKVKDGLDSDHEKQQALDSQLAEDIKIGKIAVQTGLTDGANPFAEIVKEAVTDGTKQEVKDLLLVHAINKGDIDLVGHLIEKGADVKNKKVIDAASDRIEVDKDDKIADVSRSSKESFTEGSDKERSRAPSEEILSDLGESDSEAEVKKPGWLTRNVIQPFVIQPLRSLGILNPKDKTSKTIENELTAANLARLEPDTDSTRSSSQKSSDPKQKTSQTNSLASGRRSVEDMLETSSQSPKASSVDVSREIGPSPAAASKTENGDSVLSTSASIVAQPAAPPSEFLETMSQDAFGSARSPAPDSKISMSNMRRTNSESIVAEPAAAPQSQNPPAQANSGNPLSRPAISSSSASASVAPAQNMGPDMSRLSSDASIYSTGLNTGAARSASSIGLNTGTSGSDSSIGLNTDTPGSDSSTGVNQGTAKSGNNMFNASSAPFSGSSTDNYANSSMMPTLSQDPSSSGRYMQTSRDVPPMIPPSSPQRIYNAYAPKNLEQIINTGKFKQQEHGEELRKLNWQEQSQKDSQKTDKILDQFTAGDVTSTLRNAKEGWEFEVEPDSHNLSKVTKVEVPRVDSNTNQPIPGAVDIFYFNHAGLMFNHEFDPRNRGIATYSKSWFDSHKGDQNQEGGVESPRSSVVNQFMSSSSTPSGQDSGRLSHRDRSSLEAEENGSTEVKPKSAIEVASPPPISPPPPPTPPVAGEEWAIPEKLGEKTKAVLVSLKSELEKVKDKTDISYTTGQGITANQNKGNPGEVFKHYVDITTKMPLKNLSDEDLSKTLLEKIKNESKINLGSDEKKPKFEKATLPEIESIDKETTKIIELFTSNGSTRNVQEALDRADRLQAHISKKGRELKAAYDTAKQEAGAGEKNPVVDKALEAIKEHEKQCRENLQKIGENIDSITHSISEEYKIREALFKGFSENGAKKEEILSIFARNRNIKDVINSEGQDKKQQIDASLQTEQQKLLNPIVFHPTAPGKQSVLGKLIHHFSSNVDFTTTNRLKDDRSVDYKIAETKTQAQKDFNSEVRNGFRNPPTSAKSSASNKGTNTAININPELLLNELVKSYLAFEKCSDDEKFRVEVEGAITKSMAKKDARFGQGLAGIPILEQKKEEWQKAKEEILNKISSSEDYDLKEFLKAIEGKSKEEKEQLSKDLINSLGNNAAYISQKFSKKEVDAKDQTFQTIRSQKKKETITTFVLEKDATKEHNENTFFVKIERQPKKLLFKNNDILQPTNKGDQAKLVTQIFESQISLEDNLQAEFIKNLSEAIKTNENKKITEVLQQYKSKFKVEKNISVEALRKLVTPSAEIDVKISVRDKEGNFKPVSLQNLDSSITSDDEYLDALKEHYSHPASRMELEKTLGVTSGRDTDAKRNLKSTTKSSDDQEPELLKILNNFNTSNKGARHVVIISKIDSFKESILKEDGTIKPELLNGLNDAQKRSIANEWKKISANKALKNNDEINDITGKLKDADQLLTLVPPPAPPPSPPAPPPRAAEAEVKPATATVTPPAKQPPPPPPPRKVEATEEQVGEIIKKLNNKNAVEAYLGELNTSQVRTTFTVVQQGVIQKALNEVEDAKVKVALVAMLSKVGAITNSSVPSSNETPAKVTPILTMEERERACQKSR